jgi:hypothetical protein
MASPLSILCNFPTFGRCYKQLIWTQTCRILSHGSSPKADPTLNRTTPCNFWVKRIPPCLWWFGNPGLLINGSSSLGWLIRRIWYKKEDGLVVKGVSFVTECKKLHHNSSSSLTIQIWSKVKHWFGLNDAHTTCWPAMHSAKEWWVEGVHEYGQ